MNLDFEKLADPDAPLNIARIHLRELVGATIVSHELTVAETVVFPYGEISVLFNVQGAHVWSKVRTHRAVKRRAKPEDYAVEATKLYMLIRMFENLQSQKIDELVTDKPHQKYS